DSDATPCESARLRRDAAQQDSRRSRRVRAPPPPSRSDDVATREPGSPRRTRSAARAPRGEPCACGADWSDVSGVSTCGGGEHDLSRRSQAAKLKRWAALVVNTPR